MFEVKTRRPISQGIGRFCFCREPQSVLELESTRCNASQTKKTHIMGSKVREVLRLIEADGWHLVRQTGSHRARFWNAVVYEMD